MEERKGDGEGSVERGVSRRSTDEWVEEGWVGT